MMSAPHRDMPSRTNEQQPRLATTKPLEPWSRSCAGRLTFGTTADTDEDFEVNATMTLPT